jgi:hypothetical protein
VKKQMYRPKGAQDDENLKSFEFKRKQGEREDSFMTRVESATLNAVQEAKMIATMKLKVSVLLCFLVYFIQIVIATSTLYSLLSQLQ